jgi:hypothetical protein
VQDGPGQRISHPTLWLALDAGDHPDHSAEIRIDQGAATEAGQYRQPVCPIILYLDLAISNGSPHMPLGPRTPHPPLRHTECLDFVPATSSAATTRTALAVSGIESICRHATSAPE